MGPMALAVCPRFALATGSGLAWVRACAWSRMFLRMRPAASMALALILCGPILAHLVACRPPPTLENLPGAAPPVRPGPPTVDGADGNDSLATAVPLTLDDERGLGDTFARPDDVDVFVVEVPDARVVEVRVLGNVSGWIGAPNPRLALRDESGALLAENDDDVLSDVA